MLSKENTNDSSNLLQKPQDSKNTLKNIKRLSSLTRANSQSNLKKIPRPSIRNKLILNTSNNSFTNNNNILSAIQEGLNFNYLNNSEEDENSKIFLLKKNYDNRISNILVNFQKAINNITKENAKELINDVIFMEKEKVIRDLYEQNAIIKNEYEENKNEMTRLQDVISALEIDLHKIQNELDQKNLEIKKLKENLANQQAENFNINLKLKGLIEQINNEKNDNINIDISKDFNLSIGNIGISDIGGVQERSILQLTEELKELNKLKDNKDDIIDINDNYTSSTLNSNNTLINKHEETINNLKNKHKEEIQNIKYENEIKIKKLNEEINIKIKEIKDIKELNKKYQIELDNNISENSKLNNKLKINDQIILLMRSKISSIKSEVKTLQKFVQDKFCIYNKDNQSILKIINQALSNYFNHTKSSSNIENSTSIIINNEEQIQELKEQIKLYENENKALNKKCSLYEKENQNLVEQISKLNMEIELMNQTFNTLKNCNKIENTNIIRKYKMIMKNKLNIMRNKYIQQIGELKTMISVLNCSMKKYNSVVIQYYNNKTNEQKKSKLIEEMQKKINGMKINQEEYIKAINKKNKKIKDLQEALKNSLASYSSGMKSIKLANYLDNEVKGLLKKNKDNNNEIENNKSEV